MKIILTNLSLSSQYDKPRADYFRKKKNMSAEIFLNDLSVW